MAKVFPDTPVRSPAAQRSPTLESFIKDLRLFNNKHSLSPLDGLVLACYRNQTGT